MEHLTSCLKNCASVFIKDFFQKENLSQEMLGPISHWNFQSILHSHLEILAETFPLCANIKSSDVLLCFFFLFVVLEDLWVFCAVGFDTRK